MKCSIRYNTERHRYEVIPIRESGDPPLPVAHRYEGLFVSQTAKACKEYISKAGYVAVAPLSDLPISVV